MSALVLGTSKRALTSIETVADADGMRSTSGAEGRSAVLGLPERAALAAEPASGNLTRTALAPAASSPANTSLPGFALASPEPLSLVLAGIAILGLVFLVRRRPT